MNLQPKKRKYRLSFRNKTSQSSFILPTDERLRKLQNFQRFPKITPAALSAEEKDKLTVEQPVFNKYLHITPFFWGGPAFTYRVSKIQVVNKNSSFEPALCDFGAKLATLPLEKISDNDQKVHLKIITTSSENKTHLPFLSEPNRPIRLNPLISHFKSCLPNRCTPLRSHKAQALLCGEATKQKESSSGYKISNIWSKTNDLLPNDSALLLSNRLSQLCMNATLDKIRFGTSGIYFCHSGTVSAKFLETTRLAVARKLKKAGRFWIRICADTPVTARSAETRMGRGKGAISHYEGKIRPGQMFLEFSGISKEMVFSIFQELTKKTPITIKLVT